MGLFNKLRMPTKRLWESLFYYSIFAIFSASMLVATNYELRTYVQNKISGPYREILSVSNGDILNNGNSMKVLKVKTNEGLFLEIYGSAKNAIRPLIGRIQLPDARDGFFNFRGQSTNLALQDIDGDNQLEIIAPSFDDNLSAHLNVYRYNKDIRSFEAVAPQ